jgi:TonB family protein
MLVVRRTPQHTNISGDFLKALAKLRGLVCLSLGTLAAACSSPQPAPVLTLDTSGTVYEEKELDQPVRPIDIPTPDYPAELQGIAAEGRVQLEYIVGPDGHAEASSIKVLSATYPGFGQEAAKAIHSAFFRAGVKNGMYVRTRVKQLFSFHVGS